MSRDDFDAAEFLFRRMDDDDWRELLPHLWRFADYWIGRYYWPVPRAKPTASDIASTALLKLLDRPEIWKPHIYQKHLKRKEALRAFLFTLIVRAIQQELDRAFTQWRVDEPIEESEGDPEEGKPRSPGIADNGDSPEDRMSRQELAALGEEIQDFSSQRGYGEEFQLYFVLEMKPREMAKVLNLPVTRIYSRVAQLKVLIIDKFGDRARALLNGKLDRDDEVEEEDKDEDKHDD